MRPWSHAVEQAAGQPAVQFLSSHASQGLGPSFPAAVKSFSRCSATPLLSWHEKREMGGMIAARKKGHVTFAHGLNAEIVGTEGQWRRHCKLTFIPAIGACLRVLDAFDGLDLCQFFLVLPSRGQVYRRCQRLVLFGDTVSVEFLPLAAGDRNLAFLEPASDDFFEV